MESAIGNAKVFLTLQEEAGSFCDWLWAFVDGEPVQNAFREMREVPAKTPLAERISKDLQKRGFRFVGPTIVYAYMQAVGLVERPPRHLPEAVIPGSGQPASAGRA